MKAVTSTLACNGCRAEAPDIDESPYPFRCARAGQADDVDHVVTRVLDLARVQFPRGEEPNPFLKYRQLSHSYHVARAHGIADEAYVRLVGELDRAVGNVDGHGFSATPFGRSATLSDALGFGAEGGVWIKDETGNVSGSHKGRHLMGIMIHLRVVETLGLEPSPRPELAIASCGNAALAAAVVARAVGRPLHVFIPPDGDPKVVERLRQLGARMNICPRQAGVAGDPCYHDFREAVRRGALPFCCQGPDNGLTIEGGETLGYEMIAALGKTTIDRIFVQVGGGALASACIQAFAEAAELGVLARVPRFHAVQTRGAFPLKRAYDRLAERILRKLQEGQRRGQQPGSNDEHDARAELIEARFASPTVQQELRYAVTHRSEFMWPWEQAPRSVAHGILDDETYDWFAVVKGMLATGGYPIVVDEQTLVEANTLARARTGINVDHTGSAGLAGWLQLARDRSAARNEHVAVIFSGAQR